MDNSQFVTCFKLNDNEKKLLARKYLKVSSDICLCQYFGMVLAENGTAVITDNQTGIDTKDFKPFIADKWNGIIRLYGGSGHIVGLTADGKTVACGDNRYGQCNVEDWENIIAVRTESNITVGLTSDGQCLMAGCFGEFSESLGQDSSELNKQLSELQQENQKLQDELKTALRVRYDFQAEIQQLSAKNAELQKQLEQAKKEKTTLKHDLQVCEKANEQLNKTIKELNDKRFQTDISAVSDTTEKSNTWTCPKCGKKNNNYVSTCGCGEPKPLDISSLLGSTPNSNSEKKKTSRKQTSADDIVSLFENLSVSKSPAERKDVWTCPNCGKTMPFYVGTCGCGQRKPFNL